MNLFLRKKFVSNDKKVKNLSLCYMELCRKSEHWVIAREITPNRYAFYFKFS